MKLTSITVNNLFSYNGISKISFDDITCIIGTNGFGKTSILNSIKLCLGNSDIDINAILNNNAKEKECSVELDFQEFNIKRNWSFLLKHEEILKITFEDGTTLEDIEAEHFIKNKIPNFLIDFLFYDGEVGNNLLLLSNTKLKNIFDFIFDLDLLVNTQKDTLEVSKKLLEKNRDNDTSELIDLEHSRLDLIETISNQKEEVKERIKVSKRLKLDLQKLNTQIRNKSKNVRILYDKLSVVQDELNSKSIIFKELIMWEMPLILNNKLMTKIEDRSASAISIEDENLFINKFNKFTKEINSSLDDAKLLEVFRSLMINNSSEIKLSTTNKKYKDLLLQMKDLKLSLTQIYAKIKIIESSMREKDIIASLFELRDSKEIEIEQFDKMLNSLENSIEDNLLEVKDISRALTKNFKANQEKYTFIKGYEELRIIAKVSEKIYKKKLDIKLSIFNKKLKENTKNFLSQYEHIKDIYINSSHSIIISDGNELLNTELLSAGQKQVLNFLIVKTILDFKEFASFVMVDTPFGRLSNANKKLLLDTCYLSFESLILLLTDSEYDFIKTQKLDYKHYQIQRNKIGASIEEVK
ncbi:MAG: hypothetical protein DRG78_00670 [Epsilonproteobacteria bacterium]|nr:MAG: hypothetical protein DRG78_00670 [Campylobacterota bacterium]